MSRSRAKRGKSAGATASASSTSRATPSGESQGTTATQDEDNNTLHVNTYTPTAGEQLVQREVTLDSSAAAELADAANDDLESQEMDVDDADEAEDAGDDEDAGETDAEDTAQTEEIVAGASNEGENEDADPGSVTGTEEPPVQQQEPAASNALVLLKPAKASANHLDYVDTISITAKLRKETELDSQTWTSDEVKQRFVEWESDERSRADVEAVKNGLKDLGYVVGNSSLLQLLEHKTPNGTSPSVALALLNIFTKEKVRYERITAYTWKMIDGLQVWNMSAEPTMKDREAFYYALNDLGSVQDSVVKTAKWHRDTVKCYANIAKNWGDNWFDAWPEACKGGKTKEDLSLRILSGLSKMSNDVDYATATGMLEQAGTQRRDYGQRRSGGGSGSYEEGVTTDDIKKTYSRARAETGATVSGSAERRLLRSATQDNLTVGEGEVVYAESRVQKRKEKQKKVPDGEPQRASKRLKEAKSAELVRDSPGSERHQDSDTDEDSNCRTVGATKEIEKTIASLLQGESCVCQGRIVDTLKDALRVLDGLRCKDRRREIQRPPIRRDSNGLPIARPQDETTVGADDDEDADGDERTEGEGDGDDDRAAADEESEDGEQANGDEAPG